MQLLSAVTIVTYIVTQTPLCKSVSTNLCSFGYCADASSRSDWNRTKVLHLGALASRIALWGCVLPTSHIPLGLPTLLIGSHSELDSEYISDVLVCTQ